MGRILFFVLLALALYLGWRWLKIKQIRDSAAAAAARAAPRDGELIVRCSHCGLNLPQSEALAAPGPAGERWYCCDDHRQRGSAAP